MPVGRIIWELHLLVMCGQGRIKTRTLQEGYSKNGEENVLEELSIYIGIEITKNYDRTNVQEHI